MSTWRVEFWCALAEREVEVEFMTRGVPGFRQPCGVRRCSVFGPPTAIQCHRRCVDATFRNQWPWALPVHGRRGEIV